MSRNICTDKQAARHFQQYRFNHKNVQQAKPQNRIYRAILNSVGRLAIKKESALLHIVAAGDHIIITRIGCENVSAQFQARGAINTAEAYGDFILAILLPK